MLWLSLIMLLQLLAVLREAVTGVVTSDGLNTHTTTEYGCTELSRSVVASLHTLSARLVLDLVASATPSSMERSITSPQPLATMSLT
jgi:hypothetical protein